MHTCLLPVWFAAAQGLAPPLSLITPGASVGAIAMPPTPEKLVSGERLEFWMDSPNFSVQWNDEDIADHVAVAAIDALEASWQVMVDEEGWGAPTSGDTHKILVILDPELEATGLTTAYPTDFYPAGLPVIYLNPEYATNPPFFSALAAHEFGHVLQFRVRDWYGGGPDEAWYWEASSEWMAEVVFPDLNQYVWSTDAYASQPWEGYDSLEGYHQYGMVLLNSYLSGFEIGNAGLWEIWLGNTAQPWLGEIGRVTGTAASETWANFVGAYMAMQLDDAELLMYPALQGEAVSIAGELGSAYLDLGDAVGSVSISAGIGTLVRDGDWWVFSDVINIPEGEGDVVLVLTNPGDTALEFGFEIGEFIPEPSEEAEDESTGFESPPALATEPSKAGCNAVPFERTPWWWAVFFGLTARCSSRSRSRQQ
jgi:hypothetical protein